MNQQQIEAFRQIAMSQGWKQEDIDKFIADKQKMSAQQTVAQSIGELTPEQAISNPELAAEAIKQGVKIVKKEDESGLAKAQEKADQYKAMLSTIDQLEQFGKAGGLGTEETGLKGRIKGKQEELQAKSGENPDLNQYIKLRNGLIAQLKQLTGDTGILTETDAQRLIGLIPAPTENQKEIPKGFQSLRDQASTVFGGEPTKSTFAAPTATPTPTKEPTTEQAMQMVQQSQRQAPPQQPGAKGPNFDVGKFGRSMVNGVIETAYPGIGQAASGIRGEDINKITDLFLGNTKKAVTQGPSELNRKALIRKADRNNRGVSTTGFEGLGENVKESVAKSKDLFDAALPGGVELGLLGGSGGLSSGGKSLLSRVLTPTRYGSGVRNKAVEKAAGEGVTIKGDKILDGILQWKKTAIKGNPGESKKINAIVDEAKQAYKGIDMLADDATKVYHEVSSGFNASGAPKEQVRASADRALREILRKEIDNVAPGFDKGTSKIAQGLGRSKTIRKYILPTAISTGVGAGIGVPLSIGLAKILGQSRGQ